MRDEASRTLGARLKRAGREEGRESGEGRALGEALIIERVLEEERWRSVDIADAMEERLAVLPSMEGACDRQEESRRAGIERIAADQEATGEIIVRGLGRTPREMPAPQPSSLGLESD